MLLVTVLIIITSWNVRGFNNSISKRNVNRVIKETKANVILLQESKCQDGKDLELGHIWNYRNYGWSAKNSIGASGGLITS